MLFYLGTHQTDWLGHARVPLFISQRRLSQRIKLPRAAARWALDSGGFSELSLFGEWRTSARSYVMEIWRYQDQIGSLDWAAVQDWMCEPFILKKTGKSLEEHQRLTIQSWQTLMSLDPSIPWLPVLQGFEVSDYLRHLEAYRQAGCTDTYYGVGSVCRRQGTLEARQIFEALTREDVRCHGFGVKITGLSIYGGILESADSLAWSIDARRLQYPWCGATHINCANCKPFALDWRERILASI